MSTEMIETPTYTTRRSPTLGKLALALSKAQGAMTGAAKANENPYFKSKYADLASVWDACRAPLSTNQLAVIQAVIPGSPGRIAVETLLAHSSDEWISGTVELKPTKDDPQAVGSAITYARRYGLQAIVGIAPEDDDGNAASGNGKTASADVPRTKEDIPLKEGERMLPPEEDLITPEQAAKLHMRFRDALREDLKAKADPLLHDFLARKLYLDASGNPSAKAIRKTEFAVVGKDAIAFAKEL